MASLASTDVTITPLATSSRTYLSRVKEIECTIAFGDGALTYPALGVPLSTTIGAFGIPLPVRQIDLLTDRNFTSGTHWNWDKTNNTLRGFHYGYTPQVVVEEVPALTGTTTKAGTLKYPPAYIISAVATISAAITPLRIIPSSATAATLQCKMNFTTGAFTTFADTPTAIAFTYIPQQPAGPFSLANMVIDEVVAGATGNVNLANRAAAIQYLYQTSSTAARLPIAHVNASGVVAVDIQNAGATTISFNSAQNAKSCLCTYLKYSGFAQPGVEWIDQASISLTSQAKEWGKTAGDRVGGLVIPGFGGQVVGKEGSNYLSIYLGDSTPTPAVGIASFNLMTNKIVTAETTPQTSLEDVPLIFLSNLYTPHHGLAELYTGYAPIATTLRALIRF